MSPTLHAEAVKPGVLDGYVLHEAQPAPYYRASIVLTGGSHPVEPILSWRDIGVMASVIDQGLGAPSKGLQPYKANQPAHIPTRDALKPWLTTCRSAEHIVDLR